MPSISILTLLYKLRNLVWRVLNNIMNLKRTHVSKFSPEDLTSIHVCLEGGLSVKAVKVNMPVGQPS